MPTTGDDRDLIQALQEGVISEADVQAELKTIAGGVFADLPAKDVLSLVERVGGTRQWVPFSVQGTQLAGLIGAESARHIVARWGGDVINVPTLSRLKTLVRQRRVAALHSDGHSCRAIARQLRLTERAVYRIFQQIKTTEETAK